MMAPLTRVLIFHKLKLLALMRFLPKRLAKAKMLKCLLYLYGLMTKRPQRPRGRKNVRKIDPATKLDECVSIDTMESRTAGFVV